LVVLQHALLEQVASKRTGGRVRHAGVDEVREMGEVARKVLGLHPVLLAVLVRHCFGGC